MIDVSFGIFKTVPRQAIPFDEQATVETVAECTLVVEERDDFPDPLTYLAQYEVKYCVLAIAMCSDRKQQSLWCGNYLLVWDWKLFRIINGV